MKYRIDVTAENKAAVESMSMIFIAARNELFKNRRGNAEKINWSRAAEALVLPQLECGFKCVLPDSIHSSMTFSLGDADLDLYFSDLINTLEALDVPGVKVSRCD